jgi:hypothetical protein
MTLLLFKNVVFPETFLLFWSNTSILEKAGSSSPPNLIVTFSGLEETKAFFGGEEFNRYFFRTGRNKGILRRRRIQHAHVGRTKGRN